MNTGEVKILPHQACIHIEPRPSEMEECYGACRAKDWKYGVWSQCSATCGGGLQHVHFGNQMIGLIALRVVEADIDVDWFFVSTKGNFVPRTFGNNQKIPTGEGPKEMYPHQKPTRTRACRLPACGRWTTGKWSECSVTCGSGIQTRRVMCLSSDERTPSDDHCDLNTKPKKEKNCHLSVCPKQSPSEEIGDNNVEKEVTIYYWRTGLWGKCSQSCGGGIRRRQVACYDELGKHSQGCDMTQKPPDTSQCNTEPCPYWILGEWSQCSSTCGKGVQTRLVQCIDYKKAPLTKDRCVLPMPDNMKRCKSTSCVNWVWTSWTPCSTSCGVGTQRPNTVSCSKTCGKGLQTRNATCHRAMGYKRDPLPPFQGHNSEFLGLTNPDTCPYSGSRYDACSCVTDESIGPGLTTFQRISINITSLVVNTQDWTFAQTHGLQPIPFGESGDCYSKNSCPQGRFSLSLLGTGFIVSPLTKWVANGNNPSSRIRWLERGQVIQGKCGGFCGRCAPDSLLGLMLEVAPP
ncbi:A disintegrin and metalloproteinase with like protein [Argiope bruennichi]|uniref:A disintegrin and metalloproteinase with like protein n=1 Tax=Argiope bruennichi TaxID=94029 RepID=A0A8T0FQY8_ARGBR|nr:A disintegrin and metalloproteinase with like protein [Argiope bruennichi]